MGHERRAAGGARGGWGQLWGVLCLAVLVALAALTELRYLPPASERVANHFFGYVVFVLHAAGFWRAQVQSKDLE